jgi:hypothetical protein
MTGQPGIQCAKPFEEEPERHAQHGVRDRDHDDEPDRAVHVRAERPERDRGGGDACTAAAAAKAIP